MPCNGFLRSGGPMSPFSRPELVLRPELTPVPLSLLLGIGMALPTSFPGRNAGVGVETSSAPFRISSYP